jgi:phage I-like protein
LPINCPNNSRKTKIDTGEDVIRNKTIAVCEALRTFLLVNQAKIISPVAEMEISNAVMKQRILKSYSAYLKQIIKNQTDAAAKNKKALDSLEEIIN